MDTIFYNGIIHTLDKAYPEVSALAIKDGVILRLGSDEEILALKEPQTRLIDLQGRLMLPGFADTHLHLLFYGTFRRRIDLVNTTTYEEVVRMCREGAEKVRGTNRWVIGCNFNQINWTDTNKIPDRNDLDAIASDVPIFFAAGLRPYRVHEHDGAAAGRPVGRAGGHHQGDHGLRPRRPAQRLRP